jgi:hypothetical protein
VRQHRARQVGSLDEVESMQMDAGVRGRRRRSGRRGGRHRDGGGYGGGSGN